MLPESHENSMFRVSFFSGGKAQTESCAAAQRAFFSKLVYKVEAAIGKIISSFSHFKRETIAAKQLKFNRENKS